MKIYTKTGDDGQTGLFGGPRVAKDSPRIEAYGTVDELNATLGLARAAGLPGDLDQLLARVQHELFDLGAELATPEPARHGLPTLGAAEIQALEQAMDAMETELPPLKQFVLPAGSPAAAHLHLARTVCRRAERRVVSLAAAETIRAEVVIYLNRLGDLLFVMARCVNHRSGRGDVAWQKAR